MGGYGGFVGLPDSAACMHLTPLSPQHSGLDPGAYFHELSRLWKVENEVGFFFPGEKEGYALCLFEAPTNTWGSTCVLGSILGGTFRYLWERGRNYFLIPQTA